MALEDKTIKLCNCNRTMPLDAKALTAALKARTPITIHTELCRKEIGAFDEALRDPEVLVACTQEAPLFSEVADGAGAKGDLRFLNIRENAGWSAESASATPKIAALIALAAVGDPEPVPTVEYTSGGSLLIIGPADAAIGWAGRLAGQFDVNVLATSSRGAVLPAERAYQVWSGKVRKVTGYLGAFQVEWAEENPIDLEVCTRCNACVRACPEEAIDLSYQIDLDKCKGHRACVKACGAIGAIDFSRADTARTEAFDLILDLSREPVLRTPDLPQGYLAPGADPFEQALAAQKLPQLVGEFEKPKFFSYKERICAHGRSGQSGCTKCIDVCSTGAITSDGDKVKIEPHLCAGCGGCSTVCPSGAMTYAYPRVPDTGARLKAVLNTYREAGGRDACLLFHNAEEGRALVQSLGRLAATGRDKAWKGLPARVIPMEVFHVASIGMDVWVGAIAYGASQVMVVATGEEPEGYFEAIRTQMGFAQTVLTSLGYAGRHLDLVVTDDSAALGKALWTMTPASAPAKPATFNLSAEKRTTLDFAIDHLARHAPTPKEEIALAAGAPFGRIEVNKDTCTLCKACIGACPEAALLDAPEAPVLRFIERNCVQCGLCANTCPEDAITLMPRLLLTAQAKEAVVLNEAQPFNCVRCAKPFGTRQMIDAMMGRLTSHSMFAGGGALRRLQMCADCRVVDMMDSKDEPSILDVPRHS